MLAREALNHGSVSLLYHIPPDLSVHTLMRPHLEFGVSWGSEGTCGWPTYFRYYRSVHDLFGQRCTKFHYRTSNLTWKRCCTKLREFSSSSEQENSLNLANLKLTLNWAQLIPAGVPVLLIAPGVHSVVTTSELESVCEGELCPAGRVGGLAVG